MSDIKQSNVDVLVIVGLRNVSYFFPDSSISRELVLLVSLQLTGLQDLPSMVLKPESLTSVPTRSSLDRLMV